MVMQSTRTKAARRLTTSEIRQVTRAEVRQIHRENIRQSLEHRFQVAKAQGDQNLIQLLEAERKQLASL